MLPSRTLDTVATGSPSPATGAAAAARTIDELLFRRGSWRALDATNGSVRWTFPTEAPVRFAPVFWNGAVYVASDDGHRRSLGFQQCHAISFAHGRPYLQVRRDAERRYVFHI